MKGLNIIVENDNYLSIKNWDGEIKISDLRWNNSFNSLLGLFDVCYFRGDRQWANDEDFHQTINFLSEDILLYSSKRPSEILFRLKHSSMMSNRLLVSKLWEYYEYPSFIFLEDNSNEEDLINAFKHNIFNLKIIESIDNVVILFRHFELDVLKVRTNINAEFIINSLK